MQAPDVTQRRKWFSRMLEVGLDEKIITPALLMGHVTPDVLAHHLPPEVLSRVLAASLDAGSMTPDGLLQTLTAEVLVENIPFEVLWRCLEAGAERTGISTEAHGVIPHDPAWRSGGDRPGGEKTP